MLLCIREEARIKAAIQSTNEMYSYENMDAILLADVRNVFNSVDDSHLQIISHIFFVYFNSCEKKFTVHHQAVYFSGSGFFIKRKNNTR